MPRSCLNMIANFLSLLSACVSPDCYSNLYPFPFSCFGDAGVFVAFVTDVTVDAVAVLGFYVVIFVVVSAVGRNVDSIDIMVVVS